MSTKTYDADQVSLVFGGLAIDSGYADGEFIKIEQVEDSFTAVVGTDGEVTRSKTNNNLTTITVTLMQSSDGNAILSAIHNTDKRAPNGAGVAPFLCKDRQGTSKYAAASAWIMKPPEVVFSRGAEARAWTFQADMDNRFDGGN